MAELFDFFVARTCKRKKCFIIVSVNMPINCVYRKCMCKIVGFVRFVSSLFTIVCTCSQQTFLFVCSENLISGRNLLFVVFTLQ